MSISESIAWDCHRSIECLCKAIEVGEILCPPIVVPQVIKKICPVTYFT